MILRSLSSVFNVCFKLKALPYTSGHFPNNADVKIIKPVQEANVEVETKIKRKNIKTIVQTCSLGENVRVLGWVKAFRKQKELVFLEINDGSSYHHISVVLDAVNKPDGLSMHSSVDITGVLVQSPKNSTILEVHPTSPILVLGTCDQKLFPFGGKIRYTPDYVRQFPHLRPKTSRMGMPRVVVLGNGGKCRVVVTRPLKDRFASLLRLRSATSRAINDFFAENDFTQIHTPILTSNDCEGAGEIFIVKPANVGLIREMQNQKFCNEGTVKLPQQNLSADEVFFDCRTHLTVSSQLHLESAASGLEKVWSMSPVFRAENQHSSRHLSEFYMIEAELAFVYHIDHILKVMEDLIKFIIRRILSDHIGDWNFYVESKPDLRILLDSFLKERFTVMTFDDARSLLSEKAGSVLNPGKGFSREQELILVERLNNKIPVFVINWPINIKPFYMKECPHSSSMVSAVDLLVPGIGELCGGSLRENSLSGLEARLKELDPEGNLLKSLAWYTDLRKFGGVPTGGFGMGFDRLLQLLLGTANIKDVCPFPRWPHNCSM